MVILVTSTVLAATKPIKKPAARPPASRVEPASAAKPKPAAPVEWAAKVNGDIISMALYNKRFDAAKKQITEAISSEAAEEKGLLKGVKKSILEQMIEAVILLQWAEREGIEIKDQTIKAKIQQLKKTFPTSREFYKSLADQGLSINDLEKDIKRQMVADKLISMREKALAVTDEEIKDFYKKNIDLYVQKEKVHLKQIFSDNEKDADKMRAKLAAGEPFVGEDIGLIEKGQLPVYDDSKIFKLKSGQIIGIVSGEEGYYIFKVEDKAPGKETKFEDVKESIKKFLLKEKARTQYLKDLREEKTNAKIILNEKLEMLFY